MIINLTQHAATNEQIEAGVVNLSAENLHVAIALLNFESLPSKEQIISRASALVELAISSGHRYAGYRYAMIGGAPFLMPALAEALKDAGIKPLYAFSQRQVVETAMVDGSVKKTAVFKHLGFVEG